MKENQNDTQPITHPSQKPFMLGYVVRPFKNGKSASWSRIGVAWAHKDDQGYDVCLDALPVDGRLVLRTHGFKDKSRLSFPQDHTQVMVGSLFFELELFFKIQI